MSMKRIKARILERRSRLRGTPATCSRLPIHATTTSDFSSPLARATPPARRRIAPISTWPSASSIHTSPRILPIRTPVWSHPYIRCDPRGTHGSSTITAACREPPPPLPPPRFAASAHEEPRTVAISNAATPKRAADRGSRGSHRRAAAARWAAHPAPPTAG